MKVAVSIGHSTKDSGAIARHKGITYKEYDLNKALFNELTRLKLQNGEWWQSDKMVDDLPYPKHLVQTIKNINNSDAVCCIELHHNSAWNKQVSGGMAIYWDHSIKGKLLSDYIALHMHWMPQFGFEGFKFWWRYKQHKYYKAGSVPTLKHIKRRLAYLKPQSEGGTRLPACIIEPGFMSNYDDLIFCIERRKQIAIAIRDGVDMWLKKMRDDG